METYFEVTDSETAGSVMETYFEVTDSETAGYVN
jgi:hypothetical protein